MRIVPRTGEYTLTRERTLWVLTFRGKSGKLAVIKDLSKDYLLGFVKDLKERKTEQCST